MFKLIKYLKGYYIVAFFAPLFMLLEVTMDLAQPTLMSKIVDIGIANGDLQYVLSVGAKMIGVALLGVIGGIGCTTLSSIASMKFGESLRQNVFNKVQTFSFSEIDKFQTSSIIIRLTNDIGQLQNIIMMALRMLVRAPFMCIGGVIVAFSLSKKLSLVFIVAMPILILFVTIIMKKSMPFFKTMQEKMDRVNTVMRENLLGVRVIKAFVTAEKEKKRFFESNDDLMNWSIKAQKITILMWPIVNLIMNLSIIAVLWFGGNLVVSGELEVGKIMAFINYLTQILMSLMMVIMMMMNFSRAKASADRVNEILDLDPTIINKADSKDMSGFKVEFKNVDFTYNEGKEDYVLKDINFVAEEGEAIGIIGSTGSGKSSLVNLIPRLYDCSNGEVLVGGVNVKDLKLEELRSSIGVVLQENILFSGTIEENLQWGKADATEVEMLKVAKESDAYEFISNKKDQFKSHIEQRGKNLSGGQKQRLSIARTLIKNPKILILDDSTSAVDMSTESRIQDTLWKRKGTCTIFIIAQRISAVSKADKILVIDEGKISAMGTHKELLESSEIYRNIAVSQLGEEGIYSVG